MGESEFQRREAPLPNPDTNGVSLNPTLTLGTEDAEIKAARDTAREKLKNTQALKVCPNHTRKLKHKPVPNPNHNPNPNPNLPGTQAMCAVAHAQQVQEVPQS